MKVSAPKLRTQVGCLFVLLGLAGGLQYATSTAAFTTAGQDVAPAARTISWSQYAELEQRADLSVREVAAIKRNANPGLA